MALVGRPRGFGSDPPTGSGRVGLGGRYKISRLIHVIFNGDNFSQWSQAMRSYLKGRKL